MLMHDFVLLVIITLSISIGILFALIVGRKKNSTLVYPIVLIYILTAYYLKAFLVVYYPEHFKSVANLTSRQVSEVLIEITPSLVAITLATVVALLFFDSCLRSLKSSRSSPSSPRLQNSKAAGLILAISLALKFIAHFYFVIGVPGIETQVSIPIIGGVIGYYIRFSLFALVNVYFVWSALARNRSAALWGLVLIVLFNVLELSIGVKYSIIYQAVIFFIVWIFYRKDLRIGAVSTGLMLGAVIIVASIYKYINYYRFALLGGQDPLSAIETALSSEAAAQSSFLWDMLNRVAGIENALFSYFAASKSNLVSYSALFDSSFLREFTASVTGVDNELNAVGSTQFGLLAVLSGGDATIAFLLSLGFFGFSFFMFFGLLKLIGRVDLGGKEGPVMQGLVSLFLLYFLFGAGNLQFFAKEFFVFCVSVRLFMSVFLRRSHG